jgi:hypothetical protein
MASSLGKGVAADAARAAAEAVAAAVVVAVEQRQPLEPLPQAQ